jgi:hypothetical protein
VISAPASGSDRDVAFAALRDEQRVLAVYSAVGRSSPRAEARIEPLVSVQRRHVQALVGALELTRAPSAPSVNLLATTPDQIVGGAATAAARKRLHDCERVESGSLASMLASMGAAHQVAAAVASDWAGDVRRD